MLMTAAGMVRPARVFVVGAAVAGLQAIATARRLGANVVATDVRPEVKEQIESVRRQVRRDRAQGGGIGRRRLRQGALRGGPGPAAAAPGGADRAGRCGDHDGADRRGVRTAAGDGGDGALDAPGAVLVDLAADGGGNCELSRPGETVSVNGVSIVAPLNLAATMPADASLLFSRNLTAFVQAFTKDKAFQLDFSDDIQQGALITHGGEVKHGRTREALAKEAP